MAQEKPIEFEPIEFEEIKEEPPKSTFFSRLFNNPELSGGRKQLGGTPGEIPFLAKSFNKAADYLDTFDDTILSNLGGATRFLGGVISNPLGGIVGGKSIPKVEAPIEEVAKVARPKIRIMDGKYIDINTGEDLTSKFVKQGEAVPKESAFTPQTPVTPQFNTKGKKGMTGEQQKTNIITGKKESITFEPVDNMAASAEAIPLAHDTNLPKVDKGRDTLTEVLNLPRALQSGWDMSFPFRQGLGAITKKAWWTSWDDMVKSYASEGAFNKVQEAITARPLFKPGIDGSKSYAQEVGLQLTDLVGLSNREEQIMSTWAERAPLGIGNMTRRGNRAYTAFGNQLRSDMFEQLINTAQKNGLDPIKNPELGKNIAQFVNTATGRGSLGKLEQNAKLLNNIFFSPRLIASRVQTITNALNPKRIAGSVNDPAARMLQKEAVRSLFGMLGAWTAVAGAAKLGGADVSLDPNSSDFGKIKIGNTRIDPAGGLQQYLVLLSRQMSGMKTNSTSGKSTELGSSFGGPTRGSVAMDFATNKLNPINKFVYDLLMASEGRPFSAFDRSIRMAVPLIVQDIVELAQEDPSLIPFAIPSALGMSSQTYDERGEGKSLFPKDLDFQFEGGNILR